MPAGTTLRYDLVPLEDFLASLLQYEPDVRSGFLPPARALKEARFQAGWRAVTGEADSPLSLFLLQETDALTQKVESFILVHVPSHVAGPLRELAGRLKTFLRKRSQPSLFRIDPRYGLITGSAIEPVDPSVKWDRPGAYVALYLSDDPASPSLNVLEYVPAEQRKRFIELFERYNQVPPPATSGIRTAFKKWLGGGAPVGTPKRLNYKLVRAMADFLEEEGVSFPTISLIYKDLSSEDAKRVLVDPKFGSFFLSGQDRFVASLGELA